MPTTDPIEVNPIAVYPTETYLLVKGVVEVSGCHRPNDSEHTVVIKRIKDDIFNGMTSHLSLDRRETVRRLP